MRISSQLLLTFLLNACWQIALIAGLATLGRNQPNTWKGSALQSGGERVGGTREIGERQDRERTAAKTQAT